MAKAWLDANCHYSGDMMTRSVCNINMTVARTNIGAVALVVCLYSMGVDDVSPICSVFFVI